MPFVFVSVVANFFKAISDVFVAFSAERASKPRQAVLIMLFCEKGGALVRRARSIIPSAPPPLARAAA